MKYKNLKEIMSDKDNSELNKFYEYDIIERMFTYSPTYINNIPNTDIIYRIGIVKDESSNHTKYNLSFGNKSEGIYKTLQSHSASYDVFSVLAKEFVSNIEISSYITEESFNNIISILNDYSDYLKYYTEYNVKELESVRTLQTRQDNDHDIERITGDFGSMSQLFDFRENCKNDIIEIINENYSIISNHSLFNNRQFVRYNNSMYDEKTGKELIYFEIRKLPRRWSTEKFVYYLYAMISDNDSTITHTKEIFDDGNGLHEVKKYVDFVQELQSRFSISDDMRTFFTDIDISEVCQTITETNGRIAELEKEHNDKKFIKLLMNECKNFLK